MQQASGKKKRESKNPKVSVRLNVRPLRGNWKPVKRTECDGAPRTRETASPAEEQLDCAVWKTKNVRTDIVDSICVKEHKSEESFGEDVVVPMCDCENCEKVNSTKTVLELSPREYREYLILEKKNKMKEKSKKAKSKKSKTSSKKGQRPRTRSLTASSKSTSSKRPSLLAPPNSEASPASQQNWCKLYEETGHPIKLINPKKIHTVPGQIGMSDLEPEDPETPPPTANEPKDAPRSNAPLRSPKIPILNPIVMSPVSELYNLSPPTISHQPPLVPQPPTQPQPNVVILPAPIENSVQTKKPFPPPGSFSDSNSSLVFMPPSTVAPPTEHAAGSTSKVSMIRKMENIFYNSESNWWFLVALIMLTIFAYRSSIEQHTCYYD